MASGGTLVVSKSQRLKAASFLSGSTPSAVRIADYTLTGAVAAGNNFTLALKTDGTVWAWGYNVSGQLGNNSNANQSSPVQVFQYQPSPNPPIPLTDVVAIAAGGAHSLAIKRDGSVYAWGWNGNGQLGNNSTANSWVAVQAGPGTLTNVVAIAAGYAHTLAVKSDGTLWVWGSNSSGQLGDGSTTQHNSPFQVTMLTGVSAVAAGFNHSVVLKTDGATSGTVWTAGDNTSGELGDNTATFETTPVSVLSDVVSVGAGDYYSFAIMSDATAMGWGVDSYGQLGDGSGASPWYFPTVVSTPPLFTQLDGGTYHSVGVSADGSAWAWGDGTKIGSSAYTVSSHLLTPQRVAGTGTNVFMAFAGTAHSVVASIDGAVWSWGDNSFGQWGIGNTTSMGSVPIQVPNFTLGDQSWLMGDPDHDGLPTWRELQLGTDPMNPDTNGDGLRDGAAVNSGVSPTSLDTDGDGVPNSVEIMHGTDPLRADTDGDGVDDLHDCSIRRGGHVRWSIPTITRRR
jgi:alpha-tubulin suppressor-like RCC1 family protein